MPAAPPALQELEADSQAKMAAAVAALQAGQAAQAAVRTATVDRLASAVGQAKTALGEAQGTETSGFNGAPLLSVEFTKKSSILCYQIKKEVLTAVQAAQAELLRQVSSTVRQHGGAGVAARQPSRGPAAGQDAADAGDCAAGRVNKLVKMSCSVQRLRSVQYNTVQ